MSVDSRRYMLARVSTRTRVIAAFSVALVAVSLAGCGGNDSGAGITLTDLACTYTGDNTPPAGAYSVAAVNDSSKQGVFALYGIAGGTEFADVQAFVDTEQQRLEQGQAPRPLPSYLTLVKRVIVSRQDKGSLTADLSAGEFALVCYQDDPPTAIYLVKPQLEVSG